MAKSDDNIVTKGLRGLVGKMLVFKQRADKTIVSRRPKKSLAPPSAGQEAVKERFREASAYAKAAIASPQTKSDYFSMAKGGQSAYNVAFRDYFNVPVVKLLDLSAYSGQAGDKIRVRAVDDFKVISVAIQIFDDADALVESGQALKQPNGLDWLYTSTVINLQLSGTRVVAVATDLPGNTGTLEEVI